MDNQQFTLVSTSTELGSNFMTLLKAKGEPVAALVNNSYHERELTHSGMNHIVRVHTKEGFETQLPPMNIGNIYLFEDSLPLICRYLLICRCWTSQNIYVITKPGNIPSVYKKLGADHVILTNGKNISFLIGMKGN